jgi:hypothetical protein
MSFHEQLSRTAECRECGMACSPAEYHPFAACLMFKGCHDGDMVRKNLSALFERSEFEIKSLRQSLAHADARATKAEETIRRLCDEHNAANGPTFMGEPVINTAPAQGEKEKTK